MLGTLRMDIETCIDEYLNMVPEIFPVEDRMGGSAMGKLLKVVRGRQRFDPKPLEAAVKRLVKRHSGDSCADEDKPLRFEASNISEHQKCNV